MGLTATFEVVVPDAVSEVEILRIGSACYPGGRDGEPETATQALHWALRSDWGREKLRSLGATVTPQ